ncbi:hypothetical protein A3D14_03675 [Candidatus Saccharibacteria bacterium RIFCSPHIGHO2_02_FULL_47_12]|nr:MAG: hypothetical protein A3D14_03675 [Candidatus Saccharibacteria bacterium RIFCSPHIGHO2_02_FULL_47_12]
MAIRLDDRPNEELYDDNQPTWRTNLDDDLEDANNAPTATDDNLPPGHPSRKKKSSPEELEAAEKGGGSGQADGAASAEQDKLGGVERQIAGGFKPEGRGGTSKFLGQLDKLSTRQKWIGGGVGAGVVGSIVGLLMIASGPLQFIHMAQLLQKFHFGINEETGNIRTVKLLRYMKDGKAQNLRMGKVGNAVADHYEGVLNKKGISSTYGKLAKFNGFDINPTLAEEGSKYSGKSLDEVEADLRNNYNDIDVSRVRVDIDGIDTEVLRVISTKNGFFGTRSFFKNMLGEVGLSGTSSAIGKRVLGRRAGVTWHPMKKLDTKLQGAVDDLFNKWFGERAKRIRQGATDLSAPAKAEEVKDADGNNKPVSPDASDVAGQVDETTAAGKAAKADLDTTPSTSSGPFQSFQSSTVGKFSAGGVGAVGIACAVKGIADNIDQIKYANVVMPLMRMGMEMVTVGNQVMSGEDFDSEVLGFYSKQMHDEKSGSWAAARSIQAELGEEQTGPDIRDEARIPNEQNAVSKFTSAIPGLGAACSKVGQGIMTVFSAVTGPISFLTGEVAARIVESTGLLDGVIKWLAGHPIDVSVAGADFGNYVNFGARLAANEHAMSAGGRVLSGTETAQLKTEQRRLENEEQRTKSFAERMFNPYNPRSLASKIIDKQNPDASANVTGVANGLLGARNIFSSLPKAISSVFTGKAMAAEPYNYEFPLIGRSADELNNPRYDNPFENADRVGTRLQSDGDSLKKDAKECFGATVDSQGGVKFDTPVKDMYSNLPAKCTDPNNTNMIDLGVFVGDMQAIEALACYAGQDDSCKVLGFGTTSTETVSVTNKSVYLVGDSLTVGMESAGLDDQLTAKGFTPTTDGLVSRRITGGPAPDGITKIEQDKAVVAGVGSIIVELGTNDSAGALLAELQQMLDKIRSINSVARIYWVNYVGSGSAAAAQQEKTTILTAFAQENGIKIIDWASVGSQYVSADSDYGVHPFGNYDKMVEVIVSSLGIP